MMFLFLSGRFFTVGVRTACLCKQADRLSVLFLAALLTAAFNWSIIFTDVWIFLTAFSFFHVRQII